jgi:hypothetical protein
VGKAEPGRRKRAKREDFPGLEGMGMEMDGKDAGIGMGRYRCRYQSRCRCRYVRMGYVQYAQR